MGRMENPEVRRILSRGINFSHLFLPFAGGSLPAAAQWEEMKSGLKNSEFRQVRELGFTHLRLNLGRGFLQDPRNPRPLRPEGLELLDRSLRMAEQAGLGAVLDMHQTPPPDLFHDRKEREAYRSLWQGLAAHYARRHPSVVFELINEPRVPELAGPDPSREDLEAWRGILRELVEAVRREDPERFIVVTGGGKGDAEDLLRLGSLGLPGLLYSFHYYLPMAFTHQGAEWAGPALSALRNVPYPIPGPEAARLRGAARAAGMDPGVLTVPEEGFGREAMAQTLEGVLRFSKKERVPLYCGGFGAYKPFAPPADRARWTGDVADLLQAQGVPWALWAYRADFDLVDAQGLPDGAMVEALGLKRGRHA